MAKELTINAANPQIEILLTPIIIGDLPTIREALESKYKILQTIPIFDDIDPISGHSISRIDDNGLPIPGTTRSLLTYISEQIQTNNLESIAEGDQFILGSVLTQRVRDIKEETSMDRVLEYLTKQIPILDKTNADISQNKSYTAENKEFVKGSIDELLRTIEKYQTNILEIQQIISTQSQASAALFAISPGISSATLQENQKKGAAMVPGIKQMIDGESGLREQCMKALTFALALPEELNRINHTISGEEQMTIEQLDTAGMNQSVLTEVATKPAQTKLIELEAKKADIQATLELLDTTLQEAIIELETAQTKVASVRSEKSTIEVRIKLAQTQAKIKASPSKSKAKFSADHNEMALQESKAAAEAIELDLLAQCTIIVTRIDDLLATKISTEEYLALTQTEIDKLHKAFVDAQVAYKLSQEIFTHTKDMLDNTLAQKLIDLESERLELKNANTTSLLHIKTHASLMRAKAENEANAKLIKILDITTEIIKHFKDQEDALQQKFSSDPTEENKAALVSFHSPNGEVINKINAAYTEYNRRTEEKEAAFIQIKADYESKITREEEAAKDMLDVLQKSTDKSIELAHNKHDSELEQAKMLVINAYEHLQDASKDVNTVVEDISFIAIPIAMEDLEHNAAAFIDDVHPLGVTGSDE